MQRLSGALHMSANITKFTIKMYFSHILFLCSTESIVQNFTPVLYIVYTTLLTFDFFFWKVFLATCWPQRIPFKVLEISAVDSMEYTFCTRVH